MKWKSFVLFLSLLVLLFSALASPAHSQVPKISGIPTLPVNLGTVKIGGTSEKPITIKNAGTSDLVINDISITGLNASEFNQTNDCTTILAGGSCTITATFSPALPFGPKSAAVSISSNDPTRPTVNVKILGNAAPPKISVYPLLSVNFGSVQVDSTSLPKTVTVWNRGVSDLVINDISIAGLNASEFSQTNDCTTIPAGGFCTVTGTFSPTAMGSKTAVLSISSNDSRRPIANVKLLGNAPPRVFQITVIQPAGGGKITRKGLNTPITSALVKENTNAWFTMKPNPGYHLSAVMIDGNLIFDGTTSTDPNLIQISTSKNYDYVFKVVTGPHTLAADFAEDGQENLMLTGSLGSGYTTVAGGTESLRSGSAGAVYEQAIAIEKYVDKIVAIQSDRGYLGEDSMENSRSATINPDGTFSISLDTMRDWLLVLMDSTAPVKTDQFVGYVALNAGTENLLQVPASTSTTSSLDLGTITASGDTGQSETPIDATDFSLTSTQLLNLAKNDDAFKSVKNFVINYDNATRVYYTLRPDFRWSGSYASINGAFQNPSGYTYSNYGFQLDSNTATINMNKICGYEPQVIVKLAPPSDVTTTDARTYNIGNPISSANVKCKTATDGFIEAYEDPPDADFFATNRYGGVSQSYAAPLTGTIPQGYWLYYEGDQIKGQFDVAVASPLRVDNTIKGFVPSAKINIDETGRITSVDIKWYYWDELTSQYVEFTDITLLKYLIGTGDVFFDNHTGGGSGTRTYESVHFDPAVDTSVTPTRYSWYYGTAGPANQQLEGFGIFYSSGGIGFFFNFFRPF